VQQYSTQPNTIMSIILKCPASMHDYDTDMIQIPGSGSRCLQIKHCSSFFSFSFAIDKKDADAFTRFPYVPGYAKNAWR